MKITVARFALGGPQLYSVTDTLLLAEVAKLAALSHYGRLYGGSSSPILSGKTADGHLLKGHKHAFYLPTDEDKDGVLDHLTIWAPGGLGPQELTAIARIQELKRGDGTPPVRAELIGFGAEEQFQDPLFSRARIWRSSSPFLLSRHPKLRGYTNGGTVPKRLLDGPEDQVRTELMWRQLPPPISIKRVSGLPLRGRIVPWHEFRRRRTTSALAEPALIRGYGFRLVFDAEVQGPLALGYGCHYGLGLFMPDGGADALDKRV